MTDRSQQPLVPPEVDLRDFPSMLVDIERLFSSEFHARSDDGAWRAGLTLFLKSYHQVPAASLPDDDVALARLAELGRDTKTWRKIKAAAMRGWIRCTDGRMYHRVVAEKALEGWISKLSQRKSSAAGNAKRHGSKFDPTSIDAAIEDAAKRLAMLNPSSRALAKHLSKSVRHPPDGGPDPLPSGAPELSRRESRHPPDGSPDPLPSGSQGKRREEKRKEEKKESSSSARASRAQTPPDDDELLADLKTAAKGKIAPGCANLAPIRKLLAEGCDWKLDVLPFFSERVAKLNRPLENFGNYWLIPEIRAWSTARRTAAEAAASRGETSQNRQDRFIAEGAPEWAPAVDLWRRQMRKNLGPPLADRDGRRGWYFSAALLAAASAPNARPTEAAE